MPSVAVGRPVKRPGDESTVPEHYGMWHSVCWTIKHILPHAHFMCAQLFGARRPANTHWVRAAFGVVHDDAQSVVQSLDLV